MGCHKHIGRCVGSVTVFGKSMHASVVQCTRRLYNSTLYLSHLVLVLLPLLVAAPAVLLVLLMLCVVAAVVGVRGGVRGG